MITIKKVIVLIFRFLLVAAALVLIRLYIPPLVTLGVINAGNLFGFGVAGILALIAVFWNRFTEVLKHLWGGTGGKALISIICVLIITFCTVFLATLSQVVKHSYYTAENQKVIIVLGCQIRGSVPSSTLKARCTVASRYLEAHPEALAIATGGQGADEDLSEGQCIFNLMTENGISPDRIIIEDKSTNTDENIANAKKIIEENGFSNEVAIATSEYHQYRASMICQKNGLTASAVPSGSSRAAKPTFFTREVFGVWAQWIKR